MKRSRIAVFAVILALVIIIFLPQVFIAQPASPIWEPTEIPYWESLGYSNIDFPYYGEDLEISITGVLCEMNPQTVDCITVFDQNANITYELWDGNPAPLMLSLRDGRTAEIAYENGQLWLKIVK